MTKVQKGLGMISRLPILGRLMIFILLPLTFAIVAAYFTVRGDQPEAEEGIVRVEGANGPISIARDDLGIATVRATSDRDVFFATGYLHAQDRLWQLEVQRRTLQGRLSEIFGPATLQRDVWMRTLGLYSAAETSWPVLSEDTRNALQAYADGINAWLHTHEHLPIEFRTFGITPEPWKPVDSLAWGKGFALYLSGNLDREIEHTLAAAVLDPAEMQTFFKGTAGTPVSFANAAGHDAFLKLRDIQRDLVEAAHIGGRYVGSNAWVVSGRLTKQGAPILANDPHLSLQMPSLWYVISQHGARLRSSGMGLVGLPMVIFGENGNIAWGGTSMMADTQDLYVEQVDGADGHSYLADGHWVPFSRRIEQITVRAPFPSSLHAAIEPVRLEVRSTRHGPLISDVVAALRTPVALRWVALDVADRSVEAMLRMNYAENWQQFNAALEMYATPALNFLYADRAGNIGYIGAGHIPVRSRGTGSAPVPGWDPAYRWDSYIPYGELPRIFNPPNGYIVSANNDPTPPGYGHFISQDWAPPSRAQRIEALLKDRIQKAKAISVEDMQVIQADLVSLPAIKLRDRLLAMVAPHDTRHREALQLLAAWRGDMTATSQAASLINIWADHIRQKLFEARLEPRWTRREQAPYFDSLIAGLSIEDLTRILDDSNNPWCVTGKNAQAPECRGLLEDALEDALTELRRLAGDSSRNWAWGRVHHAVFTHAPFSDTRVLDRIFERRTQTGGSPDTINVANATFRRGDAYRQTLGAGFRQIMEVGNAASAHWVMNSTGQSGNVFSKHYDDMLEPFQRAQLVPIVRPAAYSTCLIPKNQPAGAVSCASALPKDP